MDFQQCSCNGSQKAATAEEQSSPGHRGRAVEQAVARMQDSELNIRIV